jgi:hypothetical protein
MEHMEHRVMMSANPISNAATHNLDIVAVPAIVAGNVNGGIKIQGVAPSLTATPYSASQINLSWTCGSVMGSANGYVVDEMVNGQWKQIAPVGSGSTSYSVKGLSANTTYQFQVGAEKPAGTFWSNSVSATTGIAVDHPTAATAYANVSGTLFGKNGPSFLDVQQGAVGDCWLLASLAEVANRDPQDIKNMFTPDGSTVENGTTVSLYTVRFFNSAGVAKSVVVDTELPGGGTTYDQPLNGVLWAALAEKAYVQANAAGYVTTFEAGLDNYVALDNSNHPSDTKHQGGCATWALQATTGKSASAYAVNPTNIAADWKAGDFIVLLSDGTPVSPSIVGTHFYALINCTTPDNANHLSEADPMPTKNLASYTPSGADPFVLFNPHGTTASGYAPEGSPQLGLFTADASFLSANFAQPQECGAAAVAETGGVKTGTRLAAEAATDLVLAGWGT